jgi:hypothetical protein
MFATCANPGCLNPFDFRKGGRFFRFPWSEEQNVPANSTACSISGCAKTAVRSIRFSILRDEGFPSANESNCR